MEKIFNDIAEIVERVYLHGGRQSMPGTAAMMKVLLDDLRAAGARDEVVTCAQALAAVINRYQRASLSMQGAKRTFDALTELRREWVELSQYLGPI